MNPAPSRSDRIHFCGSVGDYEWLARWYGFDVHVEPVWRGPGTVLLVLSNAGMPLTGEQMAEFRRVLDDWTVVGAIFTVVSVG